MRAALWLLRHRQKLALGLLAGCLGVLALVGARLVTDLLAARVAREEALEVLVQVSRLESAIEQAVAAARCGALRTDGSGVQAQAALGTLATQVDGRALKHVNDLSPAWQDLRAALDAKAASCGGVAAALALGAARQADRQESAVRELVLALRAEAQQALARRNAQSSAASDRVLGLVGLLFAAVLLATGSGLWQLRRALRRVAHSNGRLREEVERRNISEAALRAAQTRVSTVLEAVPDGVLAVDARGRIESCNAAAGAIFGCAAERLLGQPVADLVPELEGEALFAVPGEAAQPVQRRELRARRIDGSLFPLELTWRGVALAGQAVHIGVLRDLSERERIERMKRDFVSVVSHELRTPLTSIRGALSLLSDGSTGELPEDARKMVVMASRNCERLVELVTDILDLDQMNKGQLPIEPELIDLVKLLRESLRATLGFARLYKVRLLMPGHAGPVWVQVDPRRFSQVVGNLLSNAIKFSPEGADVTVRLEPGEGEVTVVVADQGPGIPDEFRARLFQPFAQADASDRRARGGSGLGLSITQSLVQRMGGRIEVECPPGGGSRFRVTLPLAQNDEVPSDFAPTGLDDLHL